MAWHGGGNWAGEGKVSNKTSNKPNLDLADAWLQVACYGLEQKYCRSGPHGREGLEEGLRKDPLAVDQNQPQTGKARPLGR